MDTQRAKRAFARAMEEPSGEKACVAALLHHHGVDSDGIHVSGESMLDLYEALSEAGLDARGYEGTLSGLRILDAPAILHWEEGQEGGSRFVAYYGFHSGKYVIGDPKRGIRRIGPPDLARAWKSRMLLYANGVAERAAARAGAARYRCFDVEAVGLGRERALVRSRRTGVTRVLPETEARRLFGADRFRSVAAHERRMRGDYAGGDAGSVDPETLRQWIEDGLLTEESAVREDAMRCGEDDAPLSDGKDRITAIGIPTRDRADSLLAALRSYHANASLHGRRVRFVVADSSSLPGQARCASALAALRDEVDIEVEHLDDAWRKKMMRTLADETGCSPDILRFALYGHEACDANYGANRNALLLATAGELSAQVDDDTRLPLREAPDTRSGIALSSQADPSEYWFGALDWKPADASFVEAHETLLGRPARRALAECDREDIVVEDLAPQLLRRLPDAGIGLTFVGHTGDDGTSSNVPRLFLEGASLGRLLQDGYAESVRARETGRAAARRTIGSGVFCIGMNMGLDNRRMLPPFMPAGRNEDGVFSAMLEAAFPLLLRGFCEGYAIGHHPPIGRAPFPAEIAFEGFRTNDVLTALIGEWSASQPDRLPRRLRDPGDRLAAYGALDQPDFDLACRAAVERSTGMLMLHIEHALSGPAGSIPPMRADLERLTGALERFVTQPECNAPIDLTGDAAERRARLRDLVGAYGTLARQWSDIALCAREARMREVGAA